MPTSKTSFNHLKSLVLFSHKDDTLLEEFLSAKMSLQFKVEMAQNLSITKLWCQDQTPWKGLRL
jgi:hypothetical protein